LPIAAKKDQTAIKILVRIYYQTYTGVNQIKHYHGSDRPWHGRLLHPCDRDISMSYTADAAIEPSWTDYFKTKVGVSQE
jgi:hypothetical protein